MPATDSTIDFAAQNFAGVIQRLVQKEKEVLQLQSELARLSSSTAGRDEGDAKHERAERAKQWSSLMDEIAKHKTSVRPAHSSWRSD